MAWLVRLRGLVALTIGECYWPGGEETEDEDDDDDSDDEKALAKKKKKMAEEDMKIRHSRMGYLPPAGWKWLVDFANVLAGGDFSALKELTLACHWSQKTWEHGFLRIVEPVPCPLLLCVLKQCPSGLRVLNMGTNLPDDTFASVLHLLAGPEGPCALEELQVRGRMNKSYPLQALTSALQAAQLGRFASHIKKIKFGRIVVWDGPADEARKAAMDRLLLPLVKALSHCHQLEHLSFSDERREADAQQQQQQPPERCTIAPALAMVENVIEGFWPNYSRPPNLPEDIPVSCTSREYNAYLRKVGQAFAGGAFRYCPSLMCGLKENIIVEARQVIELLQQISTPLPMLRNMELRVSARDVNETVTLVRELFCFIGGEDVATSYDDAGADGPDDADNTDGGDEEQEEGVWGGKCPSLEKLVVELDEHRLSQEGIEFVMLLVREAMLHPALKVVEVLFNHMRPVCGEGVKEMMDYMGGFILNHEDIPDYRTVELILTTVQTLNPDKHESYIRYSYHHGHRPAIEKLIVNDVLQWGSLPLPHERFEWYGRFALPGQEKKWVYDLRAARIRADAEVDGGEIILKRA